MSGGGPVRQIVYGFILLAVVLIVPGGLAAIARTIKAQFRRLTTRTVTTQAPADEAIRLDELAAVLTSIAEPISLDITDMSKAIGGLHILREISFTVESGTIHGLIGPNGSGKTTLLNCVSGLTKLDAGTVKLGGVELHGGAATHARAGIGRTFQSVLLSEGDSVRDNLLVGVDADRKIDYVSYTLRAPWALEEIRWMRAETEAWASALGLSAVLDRPVGSLTPRQRRLVEIGRALASRPKVMLLDEPAAGMTGAELEGAGSADSCREVGRDHGAPRRAPRRPGDAALRPCHSDRRRARHHHGPARHRESRPRRRGRLPRRRADRCGGRVMLTAKTTTGTLLKVEGLHAGYGGVPALSGVDLRLEAGSVTAVIGPNGAGKSTLLKCLTGMVRPRSGSVYLDGRRIDRMSSGRIAGLGVCQVPEGRRLFATQTIADNLMVAAWVQRRRRRSLTADCEAVYERFPILGERRNEFAASLSGGEAQMLAIGMALMARPRLLLLDEPSLGLAPLMVTRILDVVKELVEEGVTVLLVEQMVHKALATADTALRTQPRARRAVGAGRRAGRPRRRQGRLPRLRVGPCTC